MVLRIRRAPPSRCGGFEGAQSLAAEAGSDAPLMLPRVSVDNSREARRGGWRGTAVIIRVSSQIWRAPGQHLHAIRLAVKPDMIAHRTSDAARERHRVCGVIDRRDADMVRD